MPPWPVMAGVLLDRSHQVPGVGRVRLRLARPSDRDELHELLARIGLTADDLDARRALRCTPGRGMTICALRWDGHHERLAGVGRLDVGSGRATLLAEHPAVAALLGEALRDHAQTWARRVA